MGVYREDKIGHSCYEYCTVRLYGQKARYLKRRRRRTRRRGRKRRIKRRKENLF
jgi:hypothetical protein